MAKSNNHLEVNYKSSVPSKRPEQLKAKVEPLSSSANESFDKARESIFGTLQFSGIHDYDSRLKLM